MKIRLALKLGLRRGVLIALPLALVQKDLKHLHMRERLEKLHRVQKGQRRNCYEVIVQTSRDKER
jgi:hypothetical protein